MTLRLIKSLLFTSLFLVGCGGDDDETAYECVLLQPNQETHRLRDFQFARYRVFDLGVIDGINNIQPGDTLKALFMYQSAGMLDPELPLAVAYPSSLEPTSSPDSVTQRFRELAYGIDWEVLHEPDSGRFTLVFPRPLQNIELTTIAYYMEVRKADGPTLRFGSLDNLPFRLQIVKFANPQPADPLWAAEWRNVYDLGKRDLSRGSLSIDIYRSDFGQEEDLYSQSGQNGISFLRILELDRDSTPDGLTWDGRVDRARLWLNEGLLVFPSWRPFASPSLLETVTDFYDSDELGSWVGGSKYHLTIMTSTIGALIKLPRVNLVENSERVMLNGRRLSRAYDYEIDYPLGLVDFTELADVHHLNSFDVVQICYEYETLTQ